MTKFFKRLHFTPIFFIFLFLSILIFPGCSINRANSATDKVKIIASLFPQYDFARQIAGDKAEVSLLLPPGSESHTYDPSPSDILQISNSDIFLYTGKDMEPWADRISSSVKNEKLLITDLSQGINLIKSEHHHDGHEHSFDPHIWLDLTLAARMVDNITMSLCEKDATNADYYKRNAETLKNKLSSLDDEFKNMISTAKRKAIVFAGRFAHLYFVEHYDLDYISAFDSCSTEAEPSVKKVSKILNFIYKNEIPIIYYEETTEPKIANSIAEQTGVKTLQFSTLHNVTKEQLDSGITFVDLMRTNLENLRQGLN